MLQAGEGCEGWSANDRLEKKRSKWQGSFASAYQVPLVDFRSLKSDESIRLMVLVEVQVTLEGVVSSVKPDSAHPGVCPNSSSKGVKCPAEGLPGCVTVINVIELPGPPLDYPHHGCGPLQKRRGER